MKFLPSYQALPAWLRNGLLLLLIAAGVAIEGHALLSPHAKPAIPKGGADRQDAADVQSLAQAVDAAFTESWGQQKLQPAAPADTLTVARRISLALTGSIPSLQEIRALEAQPESERTEWWVSHLLKDRRSSDYLAERFARVFVSTESGSLISFRRGRLVEWIGNHFHENRPYDEMVRALIAGEGVWTTNPAVNFVTATTEQMKGPDETKLTTRVSRAFLGVRMDCVQCHDGKLDNPWKQTDFHQMAAFFGETNVALNGVKDDPKLHYEFRYLRKPEAEQVPAVVPWDSELLPEKGKPRERLAQWVTSDNNRPFARAIVNRVWALLFNLPLVSPVDDIPLEGPFPPGLEILAEDFTAHGCDLQRLIRAIVSTRAFQLESQSADPDHPAEAEATNHWTCFPMTRLRPEQVAGSVVQAASFSALDAEANVLLRLKRNVDVGNFVKRYGDVGEDDFDEQSGTIPQRLLMMNGSMISNYTGSLPLLNTCARIALLAPDDATAVEVAYLSAFTRRPSKEEADYFIGTLSGLNQGARSRAMSDLCWTLLNSTEFSWNH